VEGRRVGNAGVTPEEIALWTIVSLRWPLLADELALNPDLLWADDDTGVPAELRRLWSSDEVRAVVGGQGVSARLTGHAVRVLVGLPQGTGLTDVAPVSAGNGHGAVA
jgi:hypothetical protein